MGILIASIVLIISFHLKGGLMTDEKAMQRASELGMVMTDETEDNTENMENTQADTEEAKPVMKQDTQSEAKEDTQKAVKEKETQKETEVSSEKESEKKEDKSDKKSDKKSDEKSDKKSDSEDETIKFKVSKGEVCRIIAENLYNKGLVDDAESFRKYMQDNGYDNMICVGEYELKKGMSYKEIAKKLTTRLSE